MPSYPESEIPTHGSAQGTVYSLHLTRTASEGNCRNWTMSHYTPWTHKPSSLPSDRIPAHKQTAKGTSKGKQKEAGVPQSKAVRKLDKLREGLVTLGEGAPTRDPNGGCYCQGMCVPSLFHTLSIYIYTNSAREHDLSIYTPVCLRCGLILCSLNLPHHACPHCQAALLTVPARRALIQSLEQSIAHTLAHEEREREQVIEEARKAAGSFPTLAAAASGGALDAHPTNQTHKVLSLNSKTKKVIVSSYTKTKPPQPTQAFKGGNAEPFEPEPRRVPRPPDEVPFSTKPLNMERLWMNTRPGERAVTYIPPPVQAKAESTPPPSKRPSRKKKTGQSGASSQRGADENVSVRAFSSVTSFPPNVCLRYP